MTDRTARLSPAQQADVARIVWAMRAAGICWKQIGAELGLGRTRLWQIARGSEHLSARSEHLSSSQNARAE
jgi:hypothetical protein